MTNNRSVRVAERINDLATELERIAHKFHSLADNVAPLEPHELLAAQNNLVSILGNPLEAVAAFNAALQSVNNIIEAQRDWEQLTNAKVGE